LFGCALQSVGLKEDIGVVVAVLGYVKAVVLHVSKEDRKRQGCKNPETSGRPNE
jgi:rRNA processing protein Gar1